MNQFLLTIMLLSFSSLSVVASDNISGYCVVPGGDAVILFRDRMFAMLNSPTTGE